MRVCDQLEGQLVDRETVSTNELSVSALQQALWQRDAKIQRKDGEIQSRNTEIQQKNNEIQHLTIALDDKDSELQRNYNEIQKKNTEIQHLTTALHDKDVTLETLRADMSKLQITTSHPLPNKVSKQCVVIHYHYLCDVSGQ